MDIAIPPGEYLAEEIEVRGFSPTTLQLEEAMPEIPARFWLNLETDYRLTRALISKRTGFA